MQTHNLVADVKARPDVHAMVDCSDFPADHPLQKTHSKKRLGTCKEETGFTVSEVVTLKRKQWCYKTADGSEVKKAAEVEKAVTDKLLRFEHYASVVASGQASKLTMRVQ